MVPSGPWVAHQYSCGGVETQRPPNTLDPGSRARPPGQLCPPPSFLSPESGRPGCRCATAPAPCSGMGQVEASPHGGCCQDSVYACAQVHVALEGRGLPAPFLPVPRLRRAPEPWIRVPAFVYKQPPSRALRESVQWCSHGLRRRGCALWMCS